MSQQQQLNARMKLYLELIKYCNNVFYQPSATFKLPFPCIIYSRIGIDKNHADNYTPGYQRVDSYRIVVIDKDPDSPIVENIINNVKYCKYSNTINQDNMYQTHFIAKIIT